MLFRSAHHSQLYHIARLRCADAALFPWI